MVDNANIFQIRFFVFVFVFTNVSHSYCLLMLSIFLKLLKIFGACLNQEKNPQLFTVTVHSHSGLTDAQILQTKEINGGKQATVFPCQ